MDDPNTDYNSDITDQNTNSIQDNDVPSVSDKDAAKEFIKEEIAGKVAEMDQVYEDYLSELDKIQMEFLKKVTEIRKQADLKKIEELKGAFN